MTAQQLDYMRKENDRPSFCCFLRKDFPGHDQLCPVTTGYIPPSFLDKSSFLNYVLFQSLNMLYFD